MKVLLSILFIFLLIWIGFFSYLQQQCCKATPESIIYETKLLIHEGERTIVENDANFLFHYGSSEITIPPELEISLQNFAFYLKKRPAKLLILTGYTTQDEQTKSKDKNLGLLRSNGIREILRSMKVPGYQIAIQEKLVDNLYTTQGYVWDAVDFRFRTFPLKIEDGTRFKLNLEDNFRFSRSGYQLSLSESVREGLLQLVTYLNENKRRSLTIVGNYSTNEENTSIFNSLGLARATEVKQTLIELGVSERQINVEAVKNQQIDIFDVDIIGGIDFEFKKK